MLFSLKGALHSNEELRKNLYRASINNEVAAKFYSKSFGEYIDVFIKGNRLILQNTNFVETYNVNLTGNILQDILNIPGKVYYFWNNIDTKTLRSIQWGTSLN